jgi:hypothetical protein
MKKLSLLLITLIISTVALTTPAYAGYTNYVPRWVTLYPGSSAMGSYGYVKLVMAAAGTYTQYNICSVGATDATNCDLNYLYTSDQLLALFQALQNAAANGQSVAFPPGGIVAPRGSVYLFGYP